MSGQAGLGESVFIELFSSVQGGGLRANNVSLETNIDGKRETMRSMVRDYMGPAPGSNVRMIELSEHVDFQWSAQGIDFDQAFVNIEILQYRMTKYSNGQTCEGSCHISKGPKLTVKDGAITEISISLEGDPSLFS